MTEDSSRPRQVHSLWLLQCVFFSLVSQSIATDISTFQDTECQKSMNNINGPNGYPDGLCTAFTSKAAGHFSSFQVVGMDPGCTVTIYGSNAGTAECSSETLEFAEVARCYNTSWMYYSIDSCTNPELLPSSSTVVPSSTSTSSSNNSPSAGTIVGAVLGCIAALCILVGVSVYIFCFRSRRNHQVEQPVEPRELSSMRNTEMPAEKYNGRRFELSPEGLPLELGQHEPAEMEGDARYPAEVGTS